MQDNSQSAYKSWHQDPRHKTAHWAAFLMVALFATNTLLLKTDQTFASVVTNYGAAYQSVIPAKEKTNSSALVTKVSGLNKNFQDVVYAFLENGGTKEESLVVEAAKQRQSAMKALVAADPKAAVEALLSPEEVEELPASAKKYAEKHNVKLTGTYRNDHGDVKDSKTLKEIATFDTGTEQIMVYAADGKAPKGHGVKATLENGIQIDNVVLVAAGSSIKTQSAAGTVAAAAPTMHKIAAVVINNTATTDQVKGALVELNKFYMEQSYGKTSVTGDVFQVSATATCDDYYNLATQADAALKAQGVSVGNYSNTMYFTTGCWFGGLGEMPGKRTWINGLSVQVMAHELGHNEGPHHANTPGVEYGENEDVMGNAWAFHHFNAPHKYQVGWIPSSNVVNITAGGTYTLSSSETASTGRQLYRIARDSSTSIYLSLRQPSGVYDAGLPNFVAVHQWSPSPASIQTVNVANIAVGQSYSESGITVTVTGISGNTATIQVSLECLKANPTVSIYDTNMFPGQSTKYSMYITNNDSAFCPTSNTYSLSTGLPAGWTTSTLSPLTLAPGASGNVTFDLMPGAAAPGVYGISATASNGSYSGTASANITVNAPDTTGPSISLTPAEGTSITGNKLNINAYVSDPTPSSGIKTVTVYFDGVAKKTCTFTSNTSYASCIYSAPLNKVPRGSHTVGAKATDMSNNTSSVTQTFTR